MRGFFMVFHNTSGNELPGSGFSREPVSLSPLKWIAGQAPHTDTAALDLALTVPDTAVLAAAL